MKIKLKIVEIAAILIIVTNNVASLSDSFLKKYHRTLGVYV